MKISPNMSHRLTNALFGTVVLLVCGFSDIAVPLIFAIAGYHLGSRMNDEEKHDRRGHRYKDWRPWWRTEVHSSVRTLALPFFIWNAASFALQAVCGSLRLEDPAIWLKLSGLDLTQPTLQPNLWILRNLFILVLVSPLFSILVRHIRWALVLATYAFFFSWQTCHATLDPAVNGLFSYGFSLTGLCAFSLGVFLRRDHLHFSNKTFCCLALALAVFFWYAPGNPPFSSIRPLVKVANLAFVPVLCYGLWGLVPPRKLPTALTDGTHAIFVMHGLVFTIYDILLTAHDASILNRVISSAAALVLPLLVFRMLRPFPRLSINTPRL